MKFFIVSREDIRILSTLIPNNTSSLLAFKADPIVLLVCPRMGLVKNGNFLDWFQNHSDETTHKFLANLFPAFPLFHVSFVHKNKGWYLLRK